MSLNLIILPSLCTSWRDGRFFTNLLYAWIFFWLLDSGANFLFSKANLNCKNACTFLPVSFTWMKNNTKELSLLSYFMSSVGLAPPGLLVLEVTTRRTCWVLISRCRNGEILRQTTHIWRELVNLIRLGDATGMSIRVLVWSVALIPLWTCNLMAFWGAV